MIIIFLPGIVAKTSSDNNIPVDSAWIAAIKKMQRKPSDSTDMIVPGNEENVYSFQFDKTKSIYKEKDFETSTLFYFDPNIISVEKWEKLGLREKTIQTIKKYINKGGHFYKPEDLQKIYGLRKDMYERLLPYIRIEPETEKLKLENLVTKYPDSTKAVKNYSFHYTVFDINFADTTAFISLPGIGSKLAARIVNFRDKLGGFYSVDQVGEIYGLPDSTFQKIKQYLKLDNSLVKKININTATIDEMKLHPYIKYNLAKPIVAYRNEHGLFSKVEDIKKIMTVTDEIYKKRAPYLIIE